MMRIVPYKEYLEKEELKELMKKNDFLAAYEIFVHWAWIAFAFALVAFFWPFSVWVNILTIIVALFILGGKQLACAILMHDSGHKSVFSNPKVNDFIGQWFGAFPIFNDIKRYRIYHDMHHATTGLEEDPDILLTRGYPTTKMSMVRKFTRDLSGLTGVKALIGLTAIHLGFLKYNLGNKVEWVDRKELSTTDILKNLLKNFSGPLAANLILFAATYALSGLWWLYLLWPIAYVTTFQLIVRVRSIAEHSVVEDTTDPYKNTRTTHANFLEQLFFAPYHVNFHVEHHMLSGVPSYNLPKMHKLLKQRGFYEKGVYAKGYAQVLSLAMSKLP